MRFKRLALPFVAVALLDSGISVATTAGAEQPPSAASARPAASLAEVLSPIVVPDAVAEPERLTDAPTVKVDAPPTDAVNKPETWTDPANQPSEQFDAPGLERQLEAQFGARYGGMWFEPDQSVVIGVIDVTDTEEAAIKEIASVPVSVQDVEFGFHQLRAWQRAAEPLIMVPGAPAFVGVDLALNAVRIESKVVSADLRSELAAVIPERALRLVENPELKIQSTHASRTQWNSWFIHQEAGLFVNFPDRPSGCTTGFFLWSNAYGPFGSSAGHCEDVNHPAVAGDWSWWGTVNANHYVVGESDGLGQLGVLHQRHRQLPQSSREHRALERHGPLLGRLAEDRRGWNVLVRRSVER